MKGVVKIIIILGLVGVLALIRVYEYKFFYDPFMYFFEQAYQSGETIDFSFEMFFNVFLRFSLNTLVSLLILWVAFQSWGIIKFSGVIYLTFFIVLFPFFVYLMHHVQPQDYLAAFYVRRFLAHPLLILILLPAFYYYRLQRSVAD
ncbi:exosortase F system-associated membrane protein [Salinimicrobium sediminilitoris]|uniref:exosortase F system-associated membrane protein n=1 Tax=Salinimicrobium sediminilitoris TaxID=2876715 RepID=UPI001E32926A|nr:exosortase F system-associated protein [Salinimicrobium sediminilitoris]MCC8360920.1 exosortase F system-associated protein [Salinimicrobium sediminilitoris]